MGKKRIIKKSGKGLDLGRKERALSKATKHHLEKGVLHIDHMKPMSAFRFETAEDDNFKQCFALENLQLLPAIENMRKSAKLNYQSI